MWGPPPARGQQLTGQGGPPSRRTGPPQGASRSGARRCRTGQHRGHAVQGALFLTRSAHHVGERVEFLEPMLTTGGAAAPSATSEPGAQASPPGSRGERGVAVDMDRLAGAMGPFSWPWVASRSSESLDSGPDSSSPFTPSASVDEAVEQTAADQLSERARRAAGVVDGLLLHPGPTTHPPRRPGSRRRAPQPSAFSWTGRRCGGCRPPG